MKKKKPYLTNSKLFLALTQLQRKRALCRRRRRATLRRARVFDREARLGLSLGRRRRHRLRRACTGQAAGLELSRGQSNVENTTVGLASNCS